MYNLLYRTLVFASLLTAVAACVGQSTADIAAECKAADLDASFKFINSSPNDQAVAINFRNVSDHACILRGGNGAMFNNVRQGHNIWTKECRNCSSKGQQLFVAPLRLAVGETGHFLLHWKNRLVDSSSECQEAGGFNTNVNNDPHSYLVVAPKLLTSVCSVVKADSYLPGPFVEKNEILNSSLREKEPTAMITLTASASTLYAADSFSFLATFEDPSGMLPIDERSCPFAFIRTRAANGDTALEDLSPFAKCIITSSAEHSDRLITMIIRAPGLGVLNTLGATTVQVQALASPAHAHEVAMIASNKLDLNIIDPATMPRTWGVRVKGVAVSLALDKENYKIGEDVPLRIAVENFSAEKDIQSGEIPCNGGVSVEVRDSTGNTVKAHDPETICTGHGWLINYPKGKVVPELRMTLRGLGMLPDRNGIYTAVATWNVLGGAAGVSNGPDNYTLEPYAVVHSKAVTFHVLK